MIRPSNRDQSQTTVNHAATSKRPTTTLPEKLEKRLMGYALAASAAGVGLMAAATSAKADIIYTPLNIEVSLPLPGGFPLGIDYPPNHPVGTVAFFTGHVFPTSCTHCGPRGFEGFRSLNVGPGGYGRGIELGPLRNGAKIGPLNSGGGGKVYGSSYVLENGTHWHVNGNSGPWANQKGYMG
ncbi:MAG TPA: hypothetical protein VN203_28025, partial [Candidatus Acidoferrum sp.]|nr:hypothetical protein [Candidatus Acidoferrum sp.]